MRLVLDRLLKIFPFFFLLSPINYLKINLFENGKMRALPHGFFRPAQILSTVLATTHSCFLQAQFIYTIVTSVASAHSKTPE